MGRLQLHKRLKVLTPNVYYQPMTNVTLKYPCIVYQPLDDNVIHADNLAYNRKIGYQVTVLYTDADNDISDQIILTIPYASWQTHMISDNVYHDVLKVYE